VPKEWVQARDSTPFHISSGVFNVDPVNNRGLHTVHDEAAYAISRKLDTVFDTFNKTLVLQFTVKHEQFIDCGGGYFKVPLLHYDNAGSC
jgi:calreticulin